MGLLDELADQLPVPDDPDPVDDDPVDDPVFAAIVPEV